MPFLRSLQLISFTTLIALVYVHMQMKIFDLAYQGKKKENEIQHIVEENGRVTYAILSLKSAHNLGDHMLNAKSDMQFRNPQDIVMLSTPSEFLRSEHIIEQAEFKETNNPLSNLLSFVKQTDSKPR